MNRPRRGSPDFLLLFLTFALVLFGLLMVYSASSMTASFNFKGDSLHYTKRQAIGILMGLAGMFFCMNVSFEKLKKLAVPLYIGVLGLLLLVLFIGSTGAYGGKSWIALGSFTLQPAEFAKLSLVIYLAALISKKGDRFLEFKKGIVPGLVLTGVYAILILRQPDLGSCIILVLGAAAVIIAGGARLKQILLLGGTGIGLGAVYILLLKVFKPESYQLKRFTTLWDPWSDSSDSSYQIVQSLYAFGHGGVTGAGFGKSIQKLHFLTQAHNDFIFAIIGEELGFIGSSIFLLAYIVFIWRGIIVSLRCPDLFGSLTGVGIMCMIGIQALINLGGVTNSIPMTGVTLPFISYGGSSILVTLSAMGIVLGISRSQALLAPDTKAPKDSKKRT